MQFDPFLKTRKIKDVMNPSTLSLESTATASDAAKIMETHNLEAVVVVENNKLVGIVTDRDYTIKLGSHAYPIDTPIIPAPITATSQVCIDLDCVIFNLLCLVALARDFVNVLIRNESALLVLGLYLLHI